MAEIKFNAARMQQVRDRLVDISAQLNQSMAGSIDTLGSMGNIIQGQEVGTAIPQYRSAVNNELNGLITNLKALDEYLLRKISEYNMVNAQTSQSLGEINNILSQI